jgi:hypothetical protein
VAKSAPRRLIRFQETELESTIVQEERFCGERRQEKYRQRKEALLGAS